MGRVVNLFQSPCGDSMWTTRGNPSLIGPVVSIPLRGFHVDNNHATSICRSVVRVSIPLRGFHVDNDLRVSARLAHAMFQSPCGDSMWTTKQTTVSGSKGKFQSPCGDSMWTTIDMVAHR